MEALVITPEIEADVQRLAERTGTTPAEAVAAAVREKLQHTANPQPKKDVEKIREILARIHAMPVDMSPTEDEILGYDKDGIPEQPYLGR